MALDRPLVRAPEFPSVAWLNTPEPPILAELRGQVLLLDIWDFTCLSCLRTLPTLRDWHSRYEPAGLVTIGVHTPEFPFARDLTTLRTAIGRLGIRWPVAADNDQLIWTSFANRVWPTVYLVDRRGYVRLRREGESGYAHIEQSIRALLQETRPEGPELPPPLLAAEEETEGGACLPAPPELHIESLGNGQLEEDKAVVCSLPAQRPEGAYYLEGEWRLRRQGATLDSERGEIVLPFRAASVHAVVAPHPADDAAPPSPSPLWLEALLDGQPVPAGRFGRDLVQREGSTFLLVDAARTYDILQAADAGTHELRLRPSSPGVTLYAFAFGGCPNSSSPARSAPC